MIGLTRATPFFIVLNVGSGHGDANLAQQTIAQVLDEAGQAHQFVLVEQAGELQQRARHALARAQAESGVVVAAGGDGTINTIAQIVLPSGVPFAVLPQGTFNYFGRTHGIPTDTAAAARALLNATVQPVQVGLVNDRVFLVNASIGLYPEVLEDREAYKNRFGRFRIVALAAGIVTLLRGYPQLKLLVERDGAAAQPLRTPTLFVGNNRLQLEQIGIPEAAAQPHGFLVAVSPRPINRLTMLRLIVHGMLGQLGSAREVDSFEFVSLQVRSIGRRPRRAKVATDGEIIWLDWPLRFQVSPQPLYLLMPHPDERVVETP